MLTLAVVILVLEQAAGELAESTIQSLTGCAPRTDISTCASSIAPPPALGSRLGTVQLNTQELDARRSYFGSLLLLVLFGGGAVGFVMQKGATLLRTAAARARAEAGAGGEKPKLWLSAHVAYHAACAALSWYCVAGQLSSTTQGFAWETYTCT